MYANDIVSYNRIQVYTGTEVQYKVINEHQVEHSDIHPREVHGPPP